MPQRCTYLIKGKNRKTTITVEGNFKRAIRAAKDAAWRHPNDEFSVTQRCMLPGRRRKRTKMAVCYQIRGTRHTECLFVRKGKKMRVI
jgi:hypothetical protein